MSPTDFLGEPWADLRARLTSEGRLGRWAEREPALAGLPDLDALAQVVHSRRDLDFTDEVFVALLRLAAADNGDDQDAGLVVAHLMQHAARAIAVSLRDLSDDIDAVVAAELWVQIRSYRWQHRHRGHALGLKHDTRAAVVHELCPPRTDDGYRRTVLRAPEVLSWVSDLHTTAELDGDVEGVVDDAEEELLDVLSWAQGSGVLTGEDVQLLLEFELAALPQRYALADAHGVAEQTLRRRCRKAKARLYDARLVYLGQAA
jgi:hypothetical protein